MATSLGVNRKNVERYDKTLREKGVEYFFTRKEMRGRCYKLTPDVLSEIQTLLDADRNMRSISKEYGISKSSIRYHISRGNLKKVIPLSSPGSSPSERARAYVSASYCMGMAATRVEERVCRALGMGDVPELLFEPCRSVPHGGVLLMLPFLLECGLLNYRSHYRQREGYYTFDSLLITLSFLYLLRVRSLEQSKQRSPGEM